MDGYDYIFKIVLVGDSGVGKSNLLSRFVKDTFTESTKSTIGVEFATKTMEIGPHNIKVQIWDTAGQERYRSITPADENSFHLSYPHLKANSYYRGAVGALVVYDITKFDSFNNIAGWFRDLKDHSDQSVEIMLVGNKCDLEMDREVGSDTASIFAQQHNISFIESSAFSNYNVTSAFTFLVNEIYEALNSKMGDLVKPDMPSGFVPVIIETETVEIGPAQEETEEKSENVQKKCCN